VTKRSVFFVALAVAFLGGMALVVSNSSEAATCTNGCGLIHGLGKSQGPCSQYQDGKYYVTPNSSFVGGRVQVTTKIIPVVIWKLCDQNCSNYQPVEYQECLGFQFETDNTSTTQDRCTGE
jgi:hypothetical protein